MSRVRGLLLACHPLPTLAVTVMAAFLAAAVGLPVGTVLLVVGAVLTGQLSIGWHNDLLDAERDSSAQRTDKPMATGGVDRRTLQVATAAASVATIGLSVLLGFPAGGAALVIVVCGWGYNLGLRATALSFVPYVIAFGVLPAVPTLALPGAPWPFWWAMTAGAALGVAAHLLNVLPDLDDDLRNGIRGLPHRIGVRGSMAATMLLVLVAAAALLFGPAGPVSWWRWAAFGVLVVAGVWVLARSAAAPGRALFRVLAASAALDVLLLAVSGTTIVRG
ncbi:UbiA family prenyltransferase [Nakamurella sp. A5-74]|uniref:UbiA family prenyltransferase n=1 Tax=Nakamurella sp. A5-74 TaxID=3158264 RepID=A0AAU8DMA0_9ACTN